MQSSGVHSKWRESVVELSDSARVLPVEEFRLSRFGWIPRRAGCWLVAILMGGLFGGLFGVLCVGAEPARGEDGDEYFERHVRPILVNSCLECHGEEHFEGGLQLTSRDSLLRGGDSGPAIQLESPESSRLIEAVRQEGELRMPPDSRLSDQQLAVLATWIELGAPWPDTSSAASSPGEMVVTEADREHWSFRPIADPPLPTVHESGWLQESLDAFVLARLESAEQSHAPPADRRTLLRRAYYGLVGLPPTWEEVLAFVDDPRPTQLVFQEVVDRLLASPHYGERWGRHWLDVARYADTKDGVLMFGYDRVYPYAYTYRDYVIRAMNEDLPYDRFIHQQLAADRLDPPVEPWRLAALGFLTLGRLYDNNLHDVLDDRIDTVTRGFLGLTVSCARCHDHKYDPIPTADYYSLYGIFASCEPPLELPAIEPLDDSPERAEFEQKAAEKRAELRKFVDEQFELLTRTNRDRTDDYLVHVATTEPDPLETAIFFLSLAPDDLRPPIVARWRRLIRQRAVPDDPVFGIWHDLMELDESPEEARLADGQPASESSGGRASASVDEPERQSSFSERASRVLAFWREQAPGTSPGRVNPHVLGALSAAELQDRAAVARVYGRLLREMAEWSAESRVSESASTIPTDPAREQLASLIVGPTSPNWFPKSDTRSYMSRGEKDAYSGKIRELDSMAAKSPESVPRAMVVLDAEMLHDPRIFIRGNPSQPGRPVARQAPAILSSRQQEEFTEGSGRLELARAMTADDNPLTARVIVNRVWMHHFGQPLVGTPSDLGRRSTPPTDPDLLDHLATRFMREGWSLKKLHRWIMQSATYQQASTVPNNSHDADSLAANRQADPDNHGLWRMNRQRLEFEAMRDTLLSVAGRLEHELGGRPVDLVEDPAQRRRTVYGLVDRQSLPSMFRAFDFASPDQSVGRRSRTMVPQQTLFALNSPFVIQQARALAERSAPATGDCQDCPDKESAEESEGVEVARPSGDPCTRCELCEARKASEASDDDPRWAAERVVQLYRLALAREPEEDELAWALEFLAEEADSQSELTG